MSVVSHRLSLPQTLEKVKDWEEADSESVDEKSPLVKSFSKLYRRESSRGSSFVASEGEKEGKEKYHLNKTEEVSCGATLLRFEWMGQHLHMKKPQKLKVWCLVLSLSAG